MAPLLGATAKKTTSSSPILLIFVVIAAGFYFLIYRPQQRKAKALREQTKSWDVGDEVLTAGGIVGHIIDIDDDRVTLETSVGASFVVLKQYILRTLEEPEPAESEDESDFDEEDVGEYDGEDEHEAISGGAAEEEPEAGDEPGGTEAEGTQTTEDHPAGHGGTGTNGDDNHGPDGPPII
jgi:preprotein translocase subunit YajC